MQSDAKDPTQLPVNRNKLLLLLGGCGCLVIVAIVGFAGLIVGGVMWATDAPFQAAHAHVNAVQAGDLEAGYAGLSKSLQGLVSKDDFPRFVQERAALYELGEDWTVRSRHVKNLTARIEGAVVDSQGETRSAVVNLVYEGEAWRIRMVSIE